QRSRNQECRNDRAIDTDAHERGGLWVLRRGTHGFAEPGQADEAVKTKHQPDRQNDDKNVEIVYVDLAADWTDVEAAWGKYRWERYESTAAPELRGILK